MDASLDQPTTTTYDVIPYRSLPCAMAHVRRLETLAALLGMRPQPITECRVLELGCAAGGNLLPQAANLPGSSFVGLDLSGRQVSDGQKLIADLGLANIELRQGDLMNVGPELGQFDYIISHGLFSWLPPEAQQKVLQISAQNLAPNGVAFVSFNAYPGWALGGTVRAMMRHHTAQFDDPRKKIQQAMVFLNFLVTASDANTAYGKMLREELALLMEVDEESYLFHEHLEEFNRPLYFHEFMGLAGRQGLQYLADADFASMLLSNLPEPARAPLANLPLLEQEQYIDFLCGRRFRRTLLCHQEIALNRSIGPDTIVPYHVAATNDLESEGVNIRDESRAVFCKKDANIAVTSRLAKAALMYLKEIYPRAAAVEQVYSAAVRRLGLSPQAAAGEPKYSLQELAAHLLLAFSVRLVDICRHPPSCVTQWGERPLVDRLARLQAERGPQVTTQRHVSVLLPPMVLRMVRRLDGAHRREQLAECVQEAFAAGEIQICRDNQPVRDPEPRMLLDIVNRTLGQIAAAGLLVG